MLTVENRIDALETRLRVLEDQLAIYQLLAAYGPAVDSRSGAATGALWVEDGTYEAGEFVFTGRQEIAGLVDIEPHRTYVANGCAHVVSLPHLTIEGDAAVARGHSRVYVKDGDHWRVERASANRWDLTRTADGWKVLRRINKLLNGDASAHELLAPEAAR